MESAGNEIVYRGRCEKPRDTYKQAPRHIAIDKRVVDTAINQWQKINDELETDKPMDLARRLMVEGKK